MATIAWYNNKEIDLSTFSLTQFQGNHGDFRYGYNPAENDFSSLEFPSEITFFTEENRNDIGAVYGGEGLNFIEDELIFTGDVKHLSFYRGSYDAFGINQIDFVITDTSVPFFDYFIALVTEKTSDDRNFVNFILEGDTNIFASDGDDTIITGNGENFVNGGGGTDTLIVDHTQNETTLGFSANGRVDVIDRSSTSTSTLTQDVEVLQFGDGTQYNLDQFSNAGRLSPGQWLDLTEMYVAYFNRAADAEGLMFWADKHFEGISLEEIAEFFFDQPETRSLYPNPNDTDGFISAIYQNVLGRTPDPAGFNFWVSQLEAGNVTQGGAVYAIIQGAKSATGSSLDADYLKEKAELGLLYSAWYGLSDVSEANIVMEQYGSADDRDFTSAVLSISDFYQEQTANQTDMFMAASSVVFPLFENDTAKYFQSNDIA